MSHFFQSPPRSDVQPTNRPTLPIENVFDDESDEEIFPTNKRQKTYFSTEPNITEKIVPLHEFSSQQECVIDKQQYDNTKQYTFLHGHPSSIIIANTRTLQHKAKTRAQTATKKNSIYPDQVKEPEETVNLSPNIRKTIQLKTQEETVYLSPSTGKTCQILQNVRLSASSASTLPIKKQNPIGSPSKDFPHITTESRAGSLSEISRSNLLDCNISLSEDNIQQLLRTPTQKRPRENVTSECTYSEDFNPSKSKKSHEIEVSVIMESIPDDNVKGKRDMNNKLPTVLKSPDIVEYDIIEHIDCENNNIIQTNKICHSVQNIRKSPELDESNNMEDDNFSGTDNDYSPSEEECSDSEEYASMENCVHSDQDLSPDSEYEEATEDDILVTDETLPGTQAKDHDEWENISESPITFNEFAGVCTFNLPPFVGVTPEDIYKMFVTDEMIDIMVSETNAYAQKYIQINQQNMKRNSRMTKWSDTSSQEMRTFLAVLMAMGLCRVPNLNLYWSRNKLYRNEFISSVMTRDRFLLLLKCWHVSDVSNEDQTDKLYKIRNMFTKITENFRRIANPGKYVVIDETMIPWRGRLGFRQYIKNKSHRYGVKLYKLCTPEGYTSELEVYTGKKNQKKELEHSKKVVLRLMTNLTEMGRIVIVDNYYTSLGLAEDLLSQKTFLCGTLNKIRKYLPKQVTSYKLQKGEIIGKMNKKGVKVMKWMDKRNVLMLTTCKDHDDNLIDTGKKKRGTDECIKKPGCVLLYNKTKKGIDFSDQMSSYYTTLKRGIKWWRKVVMELIFGTALINAWIVFNSIQTDGKKLPKRLFVEKLIESLIKKEIDETPGNVMLRYIS